MNMETRSPIPGPQKRPRGDFAKVIGGFTVIVAGLLCWLYELEHIHLTTLLGCWPLALIGIGLATLVDRDRPENRGGGWGLALAGSVLLAGNLLLPEGRALEIRLAILPIRVSWPLLLVVIGGYLAWHALPEDNPAPEEER